MHRPESPTAALLRPPVGDVAADTALAQLQRQTEHLTWDAYIRAVHLQWAEPGPTPTIIRDTTFKVWERAFHELSS